MNVKLISIEGRWGQPIYPPQPPLPKICDLLPERAPLRPHARLLLAAMTQKPGAPKCLMKF